MPRDANGNYQLPAGNPVVTQTIITSVWANSTMSDLGAALTDSLDRTGKGAMQATLKLDDSGTGFNSEITTKYERTGSGLWDFKVLGTSYLQLHATPTPRVIIPSGIRLVIGDRGLPDWLNLKDNFNAVGDDATDDTTAVHAWLNGAMTDNKVAYAPPGIYQMDPFTIATMPNDLVVICDPQARFKFRTPQAAPLFQFTHPTTLERSLKWYGGVIQNLGGELVGNANSNTCLDIFRLKDVEVQHVLFDGAATYVAGGVPGTTGTDTGISAVACYNVNIQFNTFSGQGQNGFYINGSSTVGYQDIDVDGGDWRIGYNQFFECRVAGVAKRALQRVNISNNQARRCREGFIITTVDQTGEERWGARNLVVSGNHLKFMEQYGFTFRGPAQHIIVTSNTVEDHGFEQDGTTPSAGGDGLRLIGATRCIVANNIFANVDWPKSNFDAIDLNQTIVQSVTYKGDESLIHDNIVENYETGIRENLTTYKNSYRRNRMFNVTTEYSLNSASEDVIEHWDTGLTRSVTASAPSSGSTETDLHSLTVYANTLRLDGRRVTFSGYGTTPNNANAKTLRVYWGTTVLGIFTLPTGQGNAWRFEGQIWRYASNGQKGYVKLFCNDSNGAGTTYESVQQNSTMNQADTADIIIKATGQGIANNDVRQQAFEYTIAY